MGGGTPPWPWEPRRGGMRLFARGLSVPRVTERVDASESAVRKIVRSVGGVFRSEMLAAATGRGLSLEERIEVRVGLEAGCSLREIARRLGRHPSTISREVAVNGGRDAYRPVSAARRAQEAARRPKVTKLAANPALCRWV